MHLVRSHCTAIAVVARAARIRACLRARRAGVGDALGVHGECPADRSTALVRATPPSLAHADRPHGQALQVRARGTHPCGMVLHCC